MVGRRQQTRAVAAGTAVSASALCIALAPALGQEGDGGPLFTLGVSTSLSASDNADLDVVSPGETIRSETMLTFGFESVTRTQALQFSLSDTYRTGDGPGAEFGLRGPNVALSYTREMANARLELSASLTARDVDGDLTDDDLDDPDALIVDSGTLTRTNLDFGLKTGLHAPFGTELLLSERRREYSGITDPDLEDSRSHSAEAALIFQPDQATEARLAYAVTEFEQEDAVGTERTTRSLILEASRQINPVSELTGSLGWTEITEVQTAVPLTLPEISGLTASVGYSRNLPAGSVSANLSHSVTSAGGRTDLSATRAFEMPAGAVEVTLGAARPEGRRVQPTGRIAYSRSLPDRRIGVGLSSTITVGSDSAVRRRTVADVSYSLDLNDRDSLGFDLNFAWATGVDGDVVTGRTRASATASYQRALTGDWTLSAGLTHRLSREDGVGTARSNALFVTLGRDFSWRP